ncbi:MAG: CdaR family protein [Candidatus Flexifilum sp.]
MIPASPRLRRSLIENALWFAGLLVVAFFIWLTATAETDPIEQWRLAERIPIRIQPDAGLVIINADTLTTYATVRLRGQRSVRELLAADDITVTADLRGLGPGTHTVPLTASVAPNRRVTVAGISPSQITVVLDLQASQFVPVSIVIATPPALVFSAGAPEFDIPQVLVSGPAGLVAQVTEARAALDLAEQRETFSGDVRLSPVTADGRTVAGVTLEPASLRVRVPINRNSEVREVRVQPNPVGQLPEGYVLTSFDYDPRIVYVGGPADALERLPGTLLTTPIDLSGKTASFEEQVTVQLPDESLVVITGATITVRVGVDTQIITRQFDRVPIAVLGAREGYTYTLDPTEVSVLVTAPAPMLSNLSADAVRVFVDVSGLEGGSSTPVAPLATLDGESLLVDADPGNVAVLPALVNVSVTAPDSP